MTCDLLTYIKALPPPERGPFAQRCGTTLGYLRKGLSAKDKFRAELCIAIELESSGAVPCETLRPDIRWSDWEALRLSRRQPTPPTSPAQPAEQGGANA